MRIGIISDLHGNLPALETVLLSMDTKSVEKVLCLGDMVGYGASPNQVIDIIREKQIQSVLGNHDYAVLNRGGLNNFNAFAKQVILWTRARLSKESCEFLKKLSYSMEFEGFQFVHASPCDSVRWKYICSQSHADAAFQAFSHPVCFVGHTHKPVIYFEKDSTRRIVNVGSVGQPRDRDPRACWGLFDTESQQYEPIRVEYPVKQAAEQILHAGLPDYLAERLYIGK